MAISKIGRNATDTGIADSSDASNAIRINSNETVGIGTTVSTGELNIGPNINNYPTIQMTPSGTSTGSKIIMGDPTDDDYTNITAFASGAGENGRLRFIIGTHESLNIYNTGRQITQATLNNDSALFVKNLQSSSNPAGIRVTYPNHNPDDQNQYAIIFNDSSATRFYVYNDGDVQNHDNSYGAISDERIKQNIVDANSQWDDIKNVKVRNFKKKDDVVQYGNKAWSQIGVVAQELETVSPKLVKESPPTPEDIKINAEFGTLYEDGDELPEGKEVGDVKEIKNKVKSVKYSVLYMKAIKALQEAMARIETLEAEVKALKEA